MAAIVAPMKVKFQEVIGMGVFGSSKRTVSDRWTFSVFPTEGQSVSSRTVKVPDNWKINGPPWGNPYMAAKKENASMQDSNPKIWN